MSITTETALEHKKDPAVLCCRAEAGTVISAHNLEDPQIFDDLMDSGLLNLEGALTIGQVLGAKLTKTCDSLVPLTEDVLENYGSLNEEDEVREETEGIAEEPSNRLWDERQDAATQVLKIHIGEGRDINLEIPFGLTGTSKMIELPQASENLLTEGLKETGEDHEVMVRSLTRKHFKITEVRRGPETKIEGAILYIREGIEKDCIESQELVKDMQIEVITPDKYDTYSDTIMDVLPIAAKEGDSELGCGTTRVLDGVIFMITGTDERGIQIGEFGSSEGILNQNIMWGRPGCPDFGEIFIKTNVVIQEHMNMERPGPLAAHMASDIIAQEIREAIKKLDDTLVTDIEEFNQFRRPGKKKTVIVKEIMGQGAMHDNLILPLEPAGTLGAKPNVDLGNVPIVVSPLELLDGCIHALTCIGPSMKETSRHYFREPLVIDTMSDDDFDLCAVVLVGSPQVNSEKAYVSKRVGMTVEAMDVDCAFVTTEGAGNNHVDFASHIEQIGMRGIPVVGISWCALMGALVVGNKYMTNMIEVNKSEDGMENEILGCNTLCHEDSMRARAMMKNVLAGGSVKQADKKWNGSANHENADIIDMTDHIKMERLPNETILPPNEKHIARAKKEAEGDA